MLKSLDAYNSAALPHPVRKGSAFPFANQTEAARLSLAAGLMYEVTERHSLSAPDAAKPLS